MKTTTSDTAVIILKGLGHVLVGIFTPWTAALAQWINSGEWPPHIVWVGVILPLSMIGGGSALVAFTSSSWNTYQQQRKANESGQAQTTTIEPTKPTETKT